MQPIKFKNNVPKAQKKAALRAAPELFDEAV
jgi:hypothetical protein